MKQLLEFEEFNEDKALDTRLKKDNPRYPKIPVENVFLNPNAFGQPDWSVRDLQKIQVERIRYSHGDVKKLEDMPVEDIKIEDLVPTQKYLTADNLDDVEDSLDDKVLKSTITKYNGKYYILDGHHRIARRILNGEETIRSHVYIIE